MGPATDLSYQVDFGDSITFVDDGWSRFAIANGCASLSPAEVLGTSLWRWIADETTRQVYRAILAHVREGAGPVRFKFRCDAPSERRLLAMQIEGSPAGGATFATSLLVSEPRSEMRLIAADSHRSDAMLSVCGWCMRVQVNIGEWFEVEQAIRMLGLFESELVPKISHGMCPTCFDAMMSAIDDEELAASGQITVGALTPAW